MLDAMKNGVVFGGGTHRNTAVTTNRAEHGGVVTFGTTPGEHDFPTPHTEQIRHPVTGVVDDRPGATRETMRARRVGELLRQVRLHGCRRFGTHRGRSRVIKVRKLLHVVAHDLQGIGGCGNGDPPAGLRA